MHRKSHPPPYQLLIPYNSLGNGERAAAHEDQCPFSLSTSFHFFLSICFMLKRVVYGQLFIYVTFSITLLDLTPSLRENYDNLPF